MCPISSISFIQRRHPVPRVAISREMKFIYEVLISIYEVCISLPAGYSPEPCLICEVCIFLPTVICELLIVKMNCEVLISICEVCISIYEVLIFIYEGNVTTDLVPTAKYVNYEVLISQKKHFIAMSVKCIHLHPGFFFVKKSVCNVVSLYTFHTFPDSDPLSPPLP